MAELGALLDISPLERNQQSFLRGADKPPTISSDFFSEIFSPDSNMFTGNNF